MDSKPQLTSQEEPNLLPRDKLLRDNFTPAERFLFVVILLTTYFVFWLADPRSIWLLGGLLILGCLTPVILKTHEHTHPFFLDFLWPKFWLCSTPVWLLLLQHTLGLINNPITTISAGKTGYLTLTQVSHWLPVSTTSSSTWITVFGFGSCFILSTTLYIVPKSRAFFEKSLPWFCLGAVLVGIFGYIQKSLGWTQAIFTRGTGANDFFAFFPYDGHWAAFAILWATVCIAYALLTTRYDDSTDFIHSTGPWYLTGGTLLGATGFLVEAQWPAAILLLTLSALLLTVTVEFLSYSKDRHRKSIAISSGLAACLSFAAGIYRTFQSNETANQAASLREAAWDMFSAQPIFGWGIDSYERILPFYSSDFLLGQRTERAGSDLLQGLAEIGLFGCLIIIGYLATFVVRYLIGRHNIRLTNHLLMGCAAILILACFDSPFMSPAVFFSFFLIFFSALRWAELSRSKVDEVDAQRPQLVTPESQRRLPFFNTNYKEKEK